MNRRTFTKLSLSTAILGATGRVIADDQTGSAFKSLFAPSPGQLATGPKNYIDQMQFAYDHGFRAWEDNRLMRKDAKMWEKVGQFCRDKKFTMGVAVITIGHKLDFSKPGEDGMAKLEKDMKKGVEYAKAMGLEKTYVTFVPGSKNEMTREKQIPLTADTVKRCCDLVEDSGIVFCMEPVSHKMKGDDPLLRSFADGHLLCKSVKRDSCKLLADFYHEGEIGHGDKLIENAEKVWDEVAYVQYGDSPGRKQPGTGKLDLGAVTRWLRKKGYTGVIGMEHGVKGKGKEGLEALVKSYRDIDA